MNDLQSYKLPGVLCRREWFCNIFAHFAAIMPQNGVSDKFWAILGVQAKRSIQTCFYIKVTGKNIFFKDQRNATFFALSTKSGFKIKDINNGTKCFYQIFEIKKTPSKMDVVSYRLERCIVTIASLDQLFGNHRKPLLPMVDYLKNHWKTIGINGWAGTIPSMAMVILETIDFWQRYLIFCFHF